MTSAFAVRRATAADAPAIARHRAEMFADMGTLPRSLYGDLVTATVRYLERAVPAGEYLGWLAAPAGCGLETLVLHASPEGRALYESLGFAATNEMRYRGPLRP